MASSSPCRSKAISSSATASNTTTSDVAPLVASQNNGNAETAQSLDNQLRALDRFYQNKVRVNFMPMMLFMLVNLIIKLIFQQSLIHALQSDKERFPNNYWPS